MSLAVNESIVEPPLKLFNSSTWVLTLTVDDSSCFALVRNEPFEQFRKFSGKKITSKSDKECIFKYLIERQGLLIEK